MKHIMLAAFLAAAAPAWAGDAGMPPLVAAMDAIEKRQFDTAVNLLNGLVKDGDVNAMEILGNMHRLGHGVPQNLPEAARLYRMAAKDNVAARGRLAMMLAEGEGVEKDEDEALALLDTIDMPEAEHSAGVIHINRGDLKTGIAKMESAARKGFMGGMFDVVNAHLMANGEAEAAGDVKTANAAASHAYAWLHAMNQFAADDHAEQLKDMLADLAAQITEKKGAAAAAILRQGEKEGEEIAAQVRASSDADPDRAPN